MRYQSEPGLLDKIEVVAPIAPCRLKFWKVYVSPELKVMDVEVGAMEVKSPVVEAALVKVNGVSPTLVKSLKAEVPIMVPEKV